jgi:hypothetical protein
MGQAYGFFEPGEALRGCGVEAQDESATPGVLPRGVPISILSVGSLGHGFLGRRRSISSNASMSVRS